MPLALITGGTPRWSKIVRVTGNDSSSWIPTGAFHRIHEPNIFDTPGYISHELVVERLNC